MKSLSQGLGPQSHRSRRPSLGATNLNAPRHWQAGPAAAGAQAVPHHDGPGPRRKTSLRLDRPPPVCRATEPQRPGLNGHSLRPFQVADDRRSASPSQRPLARSQAHSSRPPGPHSNAGPVLSDSAERDSVESCRNGHASDATETDGKKKKKKGVPDPRSCFPLPPRPNPPQLEGQAAASIIQRTRMELASDCITRTFTAQPPAPSESP
eukprot:259454-Rhodomonas_salina.1